MYSAKIELLKLIQNYFIQYNIFVIQYNVMFILTRIMKEQHQDLQYLVLDATCHV